MGGGKGRERDGGGEGRSEGTRQNGGLGICGQGGRDRRRLRRHGSGRGGNGVDGRGWRDGRERGGSSHCLLCTCAHCPGGERGRCRVVLRLSSACHWV